jgi:hypothetical protein
LNILSAQLSSGDLRDRVDWRGRGEDDRRHSAYGRQRSGREGDDDDDPKNLPGVDYAAIDAMLIRSLAAIESATRPSCATVREQFLKR